MKINEYIKENWETLPKSKFDDLELVMFEEISRYEEGWGHHGYQGLGVNKEGKFIWAYSSGCSCNGGPRSEDATIKTLTIDGRDITNVAPESVDFEKLKVEYNTY